MSDSPEETFDPYWEWLEIPAEDQPPSYYRLLGLEDFEDDLAAIDAAAKKTTAYLHPMAAGPNRESVQKLLSEVAKARRTLLGSGAKQAYDESLRSVALASTENASAEVDTPAIKQPPPVPPPVPAVGQGGSSALVDDGDGGEDDADERSVPLRPLRKKSLLNDWRLHVASASMLFLGAVGFVYYNNTKTTRVASVAAVLPDDRGVRSEKKKRSQPAAVNRNATQPTTPRKSASAGQNRVLPDTPRKPKTRPSGKKSSLELLLAEQGLLMESSKGPENAMRPGGSKKKKSGLKSTDVAKLPPNEKLKLSAQWLNGLQAVRDFETPLEKKFEIANLKSTLTAADGKLLVQTSDPAGKAGVMFLKGVSIGVGETFAIKTDFSKSAAADIRVGLAIGGLRVQLAAKSERVSIVINGQKAGELNDGKSGTITLAVVRDNADQRQFHWVAQSGTEVNSGSGTFVTGMEAKVRVGVLAKCGLKPPKAPVTISEIAHGKLAKQIAFGETKRVDFKTATK